MPEDAGAESARAIRQEDVIREKLAELQDGTTDGDMSVSHPDELDNERLGQIRALRWVLKESASL